MAYDENLQYITTLIASADYRTKQFHLVKLHSVAGQVILTDAIAEDCIGVLQNKPNIGERALIAPLSSSMISKMVIDGNTVNAAVAAPIYATATGTGAYIAAPVTDKVQVGQVLEAVAADGIIASVLLNRRTHAVA